ncbi:MAG TPA: plasma-membrane proton-efflux P-type ATPase [Phycisphaerae bacterium]|nr:plasma-membrane proton-efflux P-type ATPase [Phycisphaerae bacterium]
MTSTLHSDSVQKRPAVETSLSSDGLTQAEAGRRIEQYGYNELPEKKSNPVIEFLRHFWGPIRWMIEAAAILSAIIHHWADFIIVLVLLVANAIVGFWEEFSAGNAIAALKANLALKARVRREGQWYDIPARALVPGDLIRLRLGDIVPADAKLLECDPVEVDQAALTGESLPVEKKTDETVFSGSVIRRGEVDAIVTATGGDTRFGRTANLVDATGHTSHFQKAVLKIGDNLIVLAVCLVVLIIAVAMFRGDPLTTTIQFALVLTVAAIPVAMPTVLSVTMAVGARLLASRRAIVSRLAAIEELAGMDTLCSDKTGTLTQNKLTLNEPYCVRGVSRDAIILAAARASRAEDNDPIDTAVLRGLSDSQDLSSDKTLRFQPFDPVSKRTEATIRTKDGDTLRVSKGAPQVILKLARDEDAVRDEAEKAIGDFASRGFRSLGVAESTRDDDWRFLGVLPLSDPPREDSKETIETAREMGVQVKMVTGDQVAIAREIAGQVGLGTHIVDAGVFAETPHHGGGQLADAIDKADGFAQVYPEHKYHIVETLQNRGHITGMTGDGVNDAPALKRADVGIAVSGATDAARAAADIVLTSPGLSVIIDAIQESRKAFQRMNSYAIYRITETVRVLLFMTLSILVFDFYPVTAVMIVMLALLNDGPILAIASDNVRYAKKPEAWDMRTVLGMSTILGVAGVVASFGLFYLGERVFGLSRELLQSFMFLKLAVAGHLTIFVTRTRGPFWSMRPAPLLLWSTILTKVLATFAAVYGWFMTPIGWKWAALIWGYAIVWFVINDGIKLAAYRILDPSAPSWLGRRGVPRSASV